MTLRVVYYILGLNSLCSPPQPPIFDTKKSANQPQLGLSLGFLPTPRKTPTPPVFFAYTDLNTS